MAADGPILIVGGGVGGLATALALARKGLRVRVFEQAQEFGAIGYGIQLGPNAFHAFERLGIVAQIKGVADVPAEVAWKDAYTGRDVVKIDTGPGFEARFRYPYIIVHRVDLHHVLMDACRGYPEIEFAPAAAVSGFEDDGTRVAATTADGHRVEGSALIGADGVRSRIRAQMFGELEPRAIGWVAHRTIVPIEQVPAGVPRELVALWGGQGFHVVHYPLRHGTLFNVVTVFRTPTFDQKIDADGYRTELMRTYADVHPVMKSLIGITDLDWRGRIADRDPIRHWARGRVILLGDSAHAALQSLAQGACMALEDGVALADLIAAADGDYPAAFKQFERTRAARTAHVILESRFFWRDFHPENQQARDRIFPRYHAMSREQVWDELAWLYDGYKGPAAVA